MDRMSLDTRSHVIYLYQDGWKLKDIQSRLKSEEIRSACTCLSIDTEWCCVVQEMD